MIICPNQNFVFVHLPKCAGTSVRTQIVRCDPDFISMGETEDHPTMGTTDMGHIPLAKLEKHLPDAYQSVLDMDAFAIVRDPMPRFGSAVRQTLWRYEKIPMATMTKDQLRPKVLKIIDELSISLDNPSHENIFFARQKDFLFNGDKQIVDAVYPIEEVSSLINCLSVRSGVNLNNEARSNQNVSLKVKGIGGLAFGINDFLRRNLPEGIHSKIKNAAVSILSKKESAAEDLGLYDLPEVQDFVSEFYAGDKSIYDFVRSQANEIRNVSLEGKFPKIDLRSVVN